MKIKYFLENLYYNYNFDGQLKIEFDKFIKKPTYYRASKICFLLYEEYKKGLNPISDIHYQSMFDSCPTHPEYRRATYSR